MKILADPPPPPSNVSSPHISFAFCQAQNASYGTIAENLSAMRGTEGSVEDMLNLKGLPSSKMQDLRNLAGMGGAGGDNRFVCFPLLLSSLVLAAWVHSIFLFYSVSDCALAACSPAK